MTTYGEHVRDYVNTRSIELLRQDCSRGGTLFPASCLWLVYNRQTFTSVRTIFCNPVRTQIVTKVSVMHLLYDSRPSVVVEAFSALLTEPTCINHLAQEHTRPVLAVTRLRVQHFHNGQTGVQADEIGQLQWTHGNVGPVLHDSINRVPVPYPCFQTDHGLVDIRHQDAVGQKARGIRRNGRDLTHRLAESDGLIQGTLACLQATDNLHTFLDRDWVHEVC